MVYLNETLSRLASRRPVFHCEADFKHPLAWELQNELTDCEIRLEFRPFPEERFYLDIWCRDQDQSFAIELKHLTRGLDVKQRALGVKVECPELARANDLDARQRGARLSVSDEQEASHTE